MEIRLQGPEPVESSIESMARSRHFLFLQGPCGRFYSHLQRSLEAEGHRCTRVAINGGDLIGGLFDGIHLYRRSFADWPQWLLALVQRGGITDLICYGDCRPYHRAAITALQPLGVTVHVLEEGYLRPNWVTCEKDGVNGNSALTRINLDAIDEVSVAESGASPEIEVKGTQWHYMLSGFVHYLCTLLLTPLFPRYQTHRDLDIAGEGALWIERFITWPLRKSRTARNLKAIARRGRPIHLALLQLNADSQLREHSSFQSSRHFAEFCIAEFAASGSPDAVLVFKNHPLDNGVINLARVIREEAEKHKLSERVFFIDSGKLVPLLEKAISVTAINSTAVHQALLRGIPTMVLGKAVFNHPQIVPRMRLGDFFRMRPHKGDDGYRKLVSLMRQTSQYNGGFYSAHARQALLPSLTKALIDGAPEPASFERQASPHRPALKVS